MLSLCSREVSAISNSPQESALDIQSQKLNATGILLAGGKSLRMNQDKAFLEFEGRPLIERSLDLLRTVFTEVLISAGKHGTYETLGLPVVLDGTENRGPLEGLYQGLKTASFDEVFFVACDMPFLDAGLIRLLAEWSAAYDIVIPRFQSGPEAGLHPLHAFYHRRCLTVIEKNLETGKLKISDLFPFCSVAYVGEADLPESLDFSRIFYNVNTREEWLTLLLRGNQDN